jgi:hypothetical protein
MTDAVDRRGRAEGKKEKERYRWSSHPVGWKSRLLIRNATRIHFIYSSLSSFFQEPGAASNNKEIVTHQVLMHRHGPSYGFISLTIIKMCWALLVVVVDWRTNLTEKEWACALDQKLKAKRANEREWTTSLQVFHLNTDNINDI